MLRSHSITDDMPMAPATVNGKGGGRRRSSCGPPAYNMDNTIFIKRSPYTQVAFDDIHLKKEEEETEKVGRLEKLKNKCSCSGKAVLKQICAYLPIIRVLRYYNFRENTIVDILSGITVGIMHIPQALAFGLLTSVKVENGLYTSVWPIIIYVIFGTSAHVSMGTSAVICIVTASVVDRQADGFKLANQHLLNATSIGNSTFIPGWEDIPEFMDFKENVAINIALFGGLILLFMGFLRLGFITAYLSESFFAAFTSGAAVHIATSQVPALLGISVPRFGGAFKIIYTYQEIFKAIPTMYYVTPIIAVCSIAFLFFVKDFINEKFKEKLPIPIPSELLVVILATLLSYVIGLPDPKYQVSVVGALSSDIPLPSLPDPTGIQDYIVDCFVIAILIFANTIAMAKICAKKHNYEIDDSQELISYGMCNFLSAFLKCFPSAVAPPRSMVASSMNAKTTLNGVFVTILMLLVILAMSALFEPLPKSALAAIIVVALKGLFINIGKCREFWRINKIDFIIWFFTIVSTVFLDIDLGLGIGVVVSLITVVFQQQFARGFRLGRTTQDSFIVEHKKYSDSLEPHGIKTFRYQSNIFFANAEIFRNTLYRVTVNPRKLLKLWQKQQKKLAKAGGDVEAAEKNGINVNTSDMMKTNSSSVSLETDGKKAVQRDSTNSNGTTTAPAITVDNKGFSVSEENLVPVGNGETPNMDYLQVNGNYHQNKRMSVVSAMSVISVMSDDVDSEDGEETVSEEKIRRIRKTHHVILDFSTVNYVDASGANVITHIFKEYDHVNIKIFLAGVSIDVRQTLDYAGVFNTIPREYLFIDVHDAIAVAKMESVLPLASNLGDFSEDEAAEDSYVTKI